ncbi:protein kinase domain-containing protein [Aliiglaciecola lipolytica]|uniref:non-specific serine/threonine protein kinase n=1 Tax=Aliiglaciecola lipolytica E3 TaxID=1127673 RepID=K6Y3B8_9ALTE|nr:DnaJ C-terminal domain-containing protein [Aliiglaciecola lipolytica]GAC12762.1 Ca2+/calmodulin-dependent protein kinase [Aliiglaciecola lipolytica E3]
MSENILALPHGTQINHYIIESVLGQGGFGVVYKAHHAHLNEQVVIKEFLPVELASRQGTTVVPHGTSKQDVYSDCLRRFMEEGRTLVKLRHQNVVRCRDLFTSNGTAYLVMDFEDGLPLDELIKSLEAQGQRYTQEQLLHFLLPMADGLAYVHQQGVLHRDIKPANVFIRRSDGSPVLIDFGAAKQNFALASQSQAPYSDFYAPMEQIEGTGEAKPTVDIHAFGALIYRIVSGTGGVKAESRILAIVSGRQDPLKSAAEYAELGYSTKFLALIDDCLKFKPDERPQSMLEVKTRLLNSLEIDDSHVEASENPMSRLDDMLELAGSDGVINETEMSMLISKGVTLGIEATAVQQYVVQEATKQGWRLETKFSGSTDTSRDAVGNKDDEKNQDALAQGQDVQYQLTCSLEETARQNVVDININKMESCGSCFAKGNVNTNCTECSGKGVVVKPQTLRVNIPQGVITGDRIRLRGEGSVAELGGKPGNLYVQIAVSPHPVFSVNGQDLHATIKVSENELTEGGQITVSAIEGQLRLKVPQGYKTGQAIRLAGKGLPFGKESAKRGDLFLSLLAAETKSPASSVATDGTIVIVIEENSSAIKNGVAQENIGIETVGNVLSPIANKGTNLVRPVTQVFSTSEDNQSVVSLNMYRGNSNSLNQAVFLGTFDIVNIPAGLKGKPKIELSLCVQDEDILLRVKDSDGSPLRLSSENHANLQRANSRPSQPAQSSPTHKEMNQTAGEAKPKKGNGAVGIFFKILAWVVFVLGMKMLLLAIFN